MDLQSLIDSGGYLTQNNRSDKAPSEIREAFVARAAILG